MKKLAQIIKELENDNSRLAKEEIIKREMLDGNDALFYGLKLACSNFYTFGIKQLPSARNSLDVLDEDTAWNLFGVLSNQLIERVITGNAAKSAVLGFASSVDNFSWDYWYSRILSKDMKCGVDQKTINKCAKELKLLNYSVPTFTCQLAKDSREHENKMKGIKLCDTKMDGSRVLTIVYPLSRKVVQYSRNGKEITNFPHIVKQFESVADKLSEPTVFDGEIMSSSFQELMSQLYRKENVNTSDTYLYLFDIIPLNRFLDGKDDTKQLVRSEKLHKLYSEVEDSIPNIKVLGYQLINLDTEEGRKSFNELNNRALNEGKEGIMIKDPDGPYECKRSASWLKLKPFITVDLKIIDIEEGSGKYENNFGAFVCEGADEEGRLIQSNVGGGFTEELRQQIWDNKKQYIGKYIEVKGDAITQNQNGTYSIRFPVFMRFREDKV